MQVEDSSLVAYMKPGAPNGQSSIHLINPSHQSKKRVSEIVWAAGVWHFSMKLTGAFVSNGLLITILSKDNFSISRLRTAAGVRREA